MWRSPDARPLRCATLWQPCRRKNPGARNRFARARPTRWNHVPRRLCCV